MATHSQRTLKGLTAERIRQAEKENLKPVCQFCWVIVKPMIIRHCKYWTKDYDQCIAEGLRQCQGKEEELRIATNMVFEHKPIVEKRPLKRSKSCTDIEKKGKKQKLM